MEVFPASVALVIRALVVRAHWARRARRLALEQATAAADANREAALEARVMVREDMVEQRDAHIEVLESRLGEERDILPSGNRTRAPPHPRDRPPLSCHRSGRARDAIRVARLVVR